MKSIKEYIPQKSTLQLCGDCGEIREGDGRLQAGLKCSQCAYSGGETTDEETHQNE